ncbi:hypothetical protein MMC22_001788 [Lobaria immixta]|nr:hypothetical protein [Lobaria immixta]
MTQTADRVYLGHKTGLAFSNLLANASAQPISWALRKFRAIATSGDPANLAADCREMRFDSVERLLTSVTLCGRPTSTSRNHRRHSTRILVGVPNFPLAARKDRANRGHEAVWGGQGGLGFHLLPDVLPEWRKIGDQWSCKKVLILCVAVAVLAQEYDKLGKEGMAYAEKLKRHLWEREKETKRVQAELNAYARSQKQLSPGMGQQTARLQNQLGLQQQAKSPKSHA